MVLTSKQHKNKGAPCGLGVGVDTGREPAGLRHWCRPWNFDMSSIMLL